MIYSCKLCKYTTDNNRNLIRHNETIKHKNNIVKAKEILYTCQFCEYITNDRRNWARHNKTKRHINLEKKKLSIYKSCHHCGMLFEKPSNLTRHLNVCWKFKEAQFKREIERLNGQIEYLKKVMKQIEDDKDHYRRMSEGAGMLAKKSIEAMEYLLNEQKTNKKVIDFGNDEKLIE